ncbi:HNH endonuclease [Methylomonas sp. OY6]|uniref:HNH endonuclease n=1 Tax=Methylomonas defluvii TaxID=3045149 RepID=A0ABU4U8B0_9GAMM|nr:HNH endonuclease [Methylomonas sp. OY6]MDX8125660.1 HNH endonuclease [Methylomonas sp. OY6]
MNKFLIDRLPDHQEETLLSEIRRVADLIDSEFITISEFDQHARISASGLGQRFGSWSKALQKAGLSHRFCRPTKYFSDEELIEKLQQIATQTCKPYVTKTEFSEHTGIDTTSFLRRFGSWRAALEKAGLQQTPGGKRYTYEECMENLLKVWTHLGRPPEYLEMKALPSTVGPKAYITRWKSWNKALHAFVDKVNSDEPDDPLVSESVKPDTIQAISQKTKSRNSDVDKREIKLGLRYRVLKRDNFKCVLCGRSPAMTPGLELHVDHIRPFSKGGKTVEENLRSTCFACNIGKGASI